MDVVASCVDLRGAISIGGWMSKKELTWLATQASLVETIVEFGSFHGRSTRAMADNAPKNARIWAVDPWNGAYYEENGYSMEHINTFVMPYFLINLKDHVRSGKVIPVRNWSYMFSLPFQVDMVFIDGDHRYETVIKDIKKALELLKIGGMICGHDWNHPLWSGVSKAVTELLGEVDVEDTIWWKIKS